MKTNVTAGVVLLMAAASCTGEGTPPIPRRTAYPRPTLPDTAMTVAEGTPLHFAVNRQATVTSEKEGWINVAYPMLGATMYVTFTPTVPATVEATKANRMERLMLNSGDRPSEHSEFVNAAGFRALVATTDGSTTPVQFLATDDSAWVVSGAVYFSDPRSAEAADSIRPMTRAIAADVFRALKNLK